MKTVLLTGGIGSGKSEVARRLRRAGYPVYDSDGRAKRLYDEVPGLLGKIEAELGCCSLRTADGSLDHQSLASVIFSDADKREKLERILYAELREDFERWRGSFGAEASGRSGQIPIAGHSEEDTPPRTNETAPAAVFFESAIALQHRDFDGLFDAVVEVSAPQSVRIRRVLKRNPGLTEAEIIARMNAQKRVSGADFVIENDGDLQSLQDKIDKMEAWIKSLNEEKF